MVQIQEKQCDAECRKSCSFKKTCSLRHLGEEVGKDLEYYTRKFLRSVDYQQDELTMVSSKYFPVKNFKRGVAKGDGHCIIHSVISLLEQKCLTVPTKEELLESLQMAFQADLDFFAPFLDGIETDPIEEIESYVLNADYRSCIVDLIIPLVAKVVKFGIVVMELDSTKTSYVTNDHRIFPSPNINLDEA